jgi:hypothetical protein
VHTVGPLNSTESRLLSRPPDPRNLLYDRRVNLSQTMIFITSNFSDDFKHHNLLGKPLITDVVLVAMIVSIASRSECYPFVEVLSQCGAPRLEPVIVIRPALNTGVFYAYDRRAMQRDWDVSGKPAVERLS